MHHYVQWDREFIEVMSLLAVAEIPLYFGRCNKVVAVMTFLFQWRSVHLLYRYTDDLIYSVFVLHYVE